MQKIRIIISDNHRDFVLLLVKFFTDMPEIEVIGVAYDGKQTIELVKQTDPDVLLLDMVMPDMDGLQVLRWIKNNNINTRVYVISAVQSEKLIAMAKLEGASEYFIKPVDLNDVCKLLMEDNSCMRK